MKENLDDFIQSNRAAFDDKQPDEKNWTRISRALFGKQISINSLPYWRAAAILFMGLSVYLLFPQVNENRNSKLVMNEFKDVEMYYVQEISDKVELIENFNSEEGLNGYTLDFKQLEAMYEVLKDEMKVRPSKKVKDALVLNLLVRIDLLNKQLEKLDKAQEESEGDKGHDVSV
jgi:hypothetical protein